MTFSTKRADIIIMPQGEMKNDLVAAKSTEEFKKMLPDAVSCVVIWNPSDDDEKSGHEHVC